MDCLPGPIQDVAEHLFCDKLVVPMFVQMHGAVLVGLEHGDRDFPRDRDLCQFSIFVFYFDPQGRSGRTSL